MKALCFLLALLFTVSSLFGCDLSHKHYTDAYGYCASCETDTAVVLTAGEDGVYASGMRSYGQYDTPYFKFTAGGEAAVRIEVIPETAEVSAVILYTRKSPYVASKYDKENPVILYDSPLEAEGEYFIRLELSRPGTLSLRIVPQ